MTTTETSTEQEQRAAAIAGLHELADFLAGHPDVPLPSMMVHARHGEPAQLVQWIDGLDDLDVGPGVVGERFDRRVFRTFGGLRVAMNVEASLVGESREVPTVATEFTPFTADEIRDRQSVETAP